MIHVFNDAKNLSLSAFSWPSRVIAGEIASLFDCNKEFVPFQASSIDFQYLTPSSHRDLLHTIVQSHMPTFKEEINECIAASFRCDASMDRTQKDHEYELLKVVAKSGAEQTKFVGIGHVTQPGSAGH